ncbi:unnamed protein product [Phaeothamnion confervicola]
MERQSPPPRSGKPPRSTEHQRERVGSATEEGLPSMRHVNLREAKRYIRTDSRESETAFELDDAAVAAHHRERDHLLQTAEGGISGAAGGGDGGGGSDGREGDGYGAVPPAGGGGSGKPAGSLLYGGIDADECQGRGELCALWVLITSKWINLMLVFVPLATLSVYCGWGDVAIFSLNFLAMVPLAAMLGDFTEEVAGKIGETAGGLMNASFGNAPELVFSLQALRANELRVVQASLLGSILSNLLLVLGSSFLAGGLFSGKKLQRYNATSAVANTSLLMVSSLALLLPTPIAVYYEASNADVLLVSRVASIFLLLMYFQLLAFQFKTHKFLFDGPSGAPATGDDSLASIAIGSGGGTRAISSPDGAGGPSAAALALGGTGSRDDECGSDDNEDDEGVLRLGTAVMGLAAVTALVAVYSDNLVDSLDGFATQAQLSKTFVGIVLIPIIGNVVEHIVSVTVAIKDKMELSMGIAVGSACQVSMFVIPISVQLGWIMDRDLSLNFPPFELGVFVLSVLIVGHLVSSGMSNWLMGSMLVTAYSFVALAFWFEHVKRYRVT